MGEMRGLTFKRLWLGRWLVLLGGLLLVTGCSSSTASLTTTSSTVPAGTTLPATTTTRAVTTVATTTSEPAATGTPVVMDSDMGVPGAMPILYLLGRPDLDVRAITVSGTGEVHCEPGVRQALGLVELAGAEAIPVACGPEEPLEGLNAFPTSWRVAADNLNGVELPAGGTASDLPAPELLVSVIGGASQPVIVYTDGPLTNLAAALRLDPGIVGNIAMVYAMGGAVDVPGTTVRNPDAEWNIWVDPTAAAEVFASGVPLTLVPLDATNQVPLNIFHLRTLQEYPGSPLAALVAAMLAGNQQLEDGYLYFWDALTAALLVDESLAEFESMPLAVVTEGRRDVAGTTERAAGGVETRVAVGVDRERFEREFLSALAGEDVGVIETEGDVTVDFDGQDWVLTCPDGLAAGRYVLVFTNRSSVDAAVGVVWLTGDATEADMLAWTDAYQPPFTELDALVFAAPGGPPVVAVIQLTQPGAHYIAGVDGGRMLSSTIGRIEVTA